MILFFLDILQTKILVCRIYEEITWTLLAVFHIFRREKLVLVNARCKTRLNLLRSCAAHLLLLLSWITFVKTVERCIKTVER